jgi:outer membrane protein TolC
MFTPRLFEPGKPISFINSFQSDGFGYDAALSIRTLYAAQFNIMQSVINKRLIKAGNLQYRVGMKSVEQHSQQLIHDLEKTITDQYIEVYQTQLQIEYLDKVIRMTKERIATVEEMVAKGLLSASDLLLLKITLKEHENTASLFQIQLLNNHGQLNMTCSIQDTSLYELAKPDLVLSTSLQNFQYQRKFENDSLTLISQQQNSEVKYAPQLNVYANTGLYSSTLQEIYRKTGFSGGARFVVPIYDGKQRKNVAKQYQYEMNNLKISNEYTSQQLSASIYYLLNQIRSTEKSISLIEEKLRAHEDLLAILKDKMLLGQTSVMDYLNSLSEYESTYQNKALTESSLLTLINQYNYLNW